MRFTILLFLFLVFVAAKGWSQFDKNNYRYVIHKTGEPIIVDGSLNEAVWQHIQPITGFFQHYPKDNVPADANTEVRICYDDRFLYVAATCMEDNSHPVIQTLKRDDITKFYISDGFSVVIDPVNNDKSGYFFDVNVAGSQVDGAVSQSGGQPQTDVNWDNVWFSEVKQNANGYTCELAIPFSSMKFNPENRYWGINFTRNDMKRSMYYLWTRFPVNFDGSDLCYNGEIEFADGVPQQRDGKFEFFPAISGKVIKDNENNKNTEYKLQGGVDAKMAISSSLNLNLSVYPDFSTVQVDQQYIDFYRFEYYVPEQRIFFLENNDLFSNFGTNENPLTPGYAYKIKPFYTRRIAIKDWEYFPMYYGARLSGNLSEKLRIGVMNVQTESYDGDPSQNYSVATFQRSVLQNSSVRGLFINRQAVGLFDNNQSLETGKKEGQDYNRDAGLEFDYITKDNKWSMLTKYHRSFNPEKYSNSNFYSAGVVYNSDKLRMQNVINHVDDNYIADAGYVPRLYQKDALRDTTIRMGYTQIMNNIFYQFPTTDKISYQSPYSNIAIYMQPGSDINEIQQELGYYIQFSDRSFMFAGFQYNHLNLLFPFDVLKNDKPLPARKYDYLNINGSWNSDPKKRFNYGFYGDYGTFYNGKKLFLEARSEFRVQPWGTFQLTYDFCKLDFPSEFGNANYHLVTGKTEIGLSRNLIWTTLAQFNTQNNNMNVNSLLQWRFRPMSDFYIVVKDDATTNGLAQKKLQVIFKLLYWLKV